MTKMKSRPKILTIAGFDPSGGAGVLADIKTFESHKCLGFAVNTANTIQNENEFIVPNWVSEDEVFTQLEILLKEHKFEYVKVGLIPSIDFFMKLVVKLDAKIIWDPILSASAGFDFKHDLAQLREVLNKIFLITPNWKEVKQLSGNEDSLFGAEELGKYTNVYLKGGHNEKQLGKDFLFFDGERFSFNPKSKKKMSEKHGSGCVLSSALTANLALGNSINRACLKSKKYIENYLSSTQNLLGHHKL